VIGWSDFSLINSV